jgi:nitrogenase molybdenum-iron protein beta chain
MAEVIGDDLKAFLDGAREAGSVPKGFPVALAHTPSFIGSHITGYDSMLLGIVEVLSAGRHREGDTDGKINLIPGFDPRGEYPRLRATPPADRRPITVLADSESLISPGETR